MERVYQIKCAAQSTLQDFKLQESAGGYTYRDSNAWATQTCNRFIYWKTSNDVLELCEQSLDVNLVGNRIKLHFQNTPVLEGISVHETPDEVYVLVATVASVHRLVFPHPRKLRAIDGSTAAAQSVSPRSLLTPKGFELSRASIFFDCYAENFEDPSNFAVLNSSMGSSLGMPIPIASTSWLTSQRKAVFVIANTAGSLLVVTLGAPQDAAGKVIINELKQTTIIERLWSGIMPSIMRGNHGGEEAAVSVVSHALQDDYLIFALCRDLQIRMWSYKQKECLMACHLLQQQIGSHNRSQSPLTVRRPVLLRKWSAADKSLLYLAAFITSAEQKQFLIYEPIVESGQYRLRNLATINAPDAHLVDFFILDCDIWSLWLDSDNTTIVLHCPIESYSSWDWRQIALESQFTHKTNINSILVDPREYYIHDIFMCGKFSLQTIGKAISILSRVPEASLLGCKVDLLIEEATKIVENKIRSSALATELTAEEYTNIESNEWQKLHSYCIQYEERGNKPLGLFTDPRTGLKAIIKKSNIEYVRQNEQFDEGILNSVLQFKLNDSLLFDESLLEVSPSLNVIMKYVNTITQSMSAEDVVKFEALLNSGEAAKDCVEALIEDSLIVATDPTSMNGEPLKNSFDNIFTKAPQLIEAFNIIFKYLELKETSDSDDSAINSQSILPILNNFLSSNSGIGVVTESVKQMSRLRFNFCRDLLILESFILQVRNKENMATDIIEKLNSNVIPQTAMFVHIYYLMTWICETPLVTTNVGSVSTEDSIAHLSLLELTDYININRSGDLFMTPQFDVGPRSILSHFIEHNGGRFAKKLLSFKLSSNEEPVASDDIWTAVIPQYITSVAQLIWPYSSNVKLAEFLVGFGQYQLLEQYIRLLDNWCELNIHMRKFLKALCYLIIGEPRKAVPLFNTAIFGLNDDAFISKFVGQTHETGDEEEEDEDDTIKPNIVYKYYNKLLQLFKIYSTRDVTIELIDSAISMLNERTDENYSEHMSSLYSTLFMCHLELGNTESAYEAMIVNPDIQQKKICLRQFIVNHCECGHLSALTSFNYSEIEDEFITIVESRARSADLLLSCDINYYEFLYSYFIKDNNYRRAASVMYEYCQRLRQEIPGIESIKKQMNCYLITLNCLKVVNPRYAWIVKPTMFVSVNRPPIFRVKRKTDLIDFSIDDLESEITVKQKIQMLDISDIRKEYELAKARLRLLEKDAKKFAIANSMISADETVTLLISAALYDIAFQICSLFKLKYEQIFEGIVAEYIHLIQSVNVVEMNAYDYFVENDTASLGFINSANMSAVEKMWHLISTYIDEYETNGQTILHKCIAEKLLSNGITIPVSLKLSYQRRDCPQLIRNLIAYNFVEDAYQLAIDYLSEFMGRETNCFDLKSNLLLPNSAPLYMPTHLFNILLKKLEDERKTIPKYNEMFKKLNSDLRRLRDLCVHTSNS